MYPTDMLAIGSNRLLKTTEDAAWRRPARPRRAARVLTLVVRLTLLALLGTSFAPAVGAAGGPWAVWRAPAPARAATAAETLGLQVLAEIDAVRAEVGEPPVAADTPLRRSSQNHADYLLANTDLWSAPTFSAHKETPGRPGYTAENSYQRAQLAGFPHWKVAEVVISASGGSVLKAEDIVGMWVDAPLHRRAILERSVAFTGFGYGSDGYHRAYVLDVGHLDPNVYHPVQVQPYPADGQTGVPTSWDGNESPQPFPELVGSYPSGYPITVFPVWGGSAYVSSSLSLRRTADGASVPVAWSSDPKYNYAFAPRKPLEQSTEYTATFTYTAASEWGGLQASGTVTWSFTTAAGSPGTTTTTSSTTTTTSPTTTTTTGPTTTTTTTSSTTTGPHPTSTTTPSLPAFTDVPDTHPHHDAILAMAAAGVVDGYVEPGGARTFRPDAPVLRQQFAKMIAEALETPVSENDVCPFPDVHVSGAVSLYPDNYVAAVAARGITRGTSVDPPLFSPWREISRAQVLTMVVRAARNELPGRLTEPPASFSGALPANDPTHGANVRWAEWNGLLGGAAPSGTGPAAWALWAPASRGEVAQILWNLTR